VSAVYPLFPIRAIRVIRGSDLTPECNAVGYRVRATAEASPLAHPRNLYKEKLNVTKPNDHPAAKSYLLDKREFESVIVSQTFRH